LDTSHDYAAVGNAAAYLASKGNQRPADCMHSALA
jgi:hypothetical protein